MSEARILAARVTEVRLETLKAAVVDEMRCLEDKFQRTSFDRSRLQHLRETLVQIEQGLHPDDGTDERLDKLVREPLTQLLQLACPGLRSVRKLRSHLEHQRDEAARKAAIVWPRPYRYIGKPRKLSWGDRYLEPGEVVELTETRATSWGDMFELVDSQVST